jgi:hypothetical protein
MEDKGHSVPKKKRRRVCVFQVEWLNSPDFRTWISCDLKEPSSVVCQSIKMDGVMAVKNHADRAKHKHNIQAQTLLATLQKFFVNINTPEQDQITASELVMTFNGVKHQHSYLSQHWK